MSAAVTMTPPSCQIPNVMLGVIDADGELVVLEDARGVQLLALVCALAANEPEALEAA